MLLFGASVAVLLMFVYFSIIQEMEGQIKNTINIQLADIGRKLILDGPGETTAAIDHLIAKDVNKMSYYLLVSPGKRIIAGNLNIWPVEDSKLYNWVVFEPDQNSVSDSPIREGEKVLAITSRLPRGYMVLVGYSLESVERVREIILRTMYICALVSMLLALVGGFLLTLSIRRRVESINEMCRRVMEGDLRGEVALKGSEDEFDHLSQNFNAMLAWLRDLIAGIRDISANVAHDLRTPLGRLRNRLEIMEGEIKLKEWQEELRGAIADIDRLVATFNAILSISQAEAGAGVERFQPVDFSAVVNDVVELYSVLAEEKKIDFQTWIEGGLTLNGDRHLLSQAVANILDNAIKYTPRSGSITVSLKQEGPRVVLKIADSGPGIPPELYSKVTEKFFRMETSRSSPGNGLGLSLTAAVVKMHGGELVFSDNGPGLDVAILL